MKHKKKKSFILNIVKALFFIILVLIISFSFSYFYYQHKLINLPSKCYTTLQSPQYFSKMSLMPVIINDLTKTLTINYINNQKLFTGQTAKTGSMRSSLSDYSILIMIKPTKEQIKIGSIVSIKREEKKNLLHRIIRIEKISQTIYYITKGDNNYIEDKQKWKFEDINGLVVGVLY